jgi:hypothetical protein
VYPLRSCPSVFHTTSSLASLLNHSLPSSSQYPPRSKNAWRNRRAPPLQRLKACRPGIPLAATADSPSVPSSGEGEGRGA